MYNPELTCSTCGKHFDFGEKMYSTPNGFHSYCYSCLSRIQDGIPDKSVDDFAEMLGLELEANT